MSAPVPTHSVHGTFVSEKINKVRWRPDNFSHSHFFLTGSVDNDENHIKLWDFHENQEEDDVYPSLISSYAYDGDVTEAKVYIVSFVFKCRLFWMEKPPPCTALAVYENDVATVGEDGCINLLTAQSQKVVRKLEEADSCSIHCVIFVKHNEILTSNLRGQMKVWDLRSSKEEPSITFMLSGDQVTPTCLTYHPTQRHLIIAGDDLGALTTWDLRQNTYPVNVLNAHDGMISEIQFHPDHPDQLFSCSTSGELWHWSTKSKNLLSAGLENADSNVWLAPDNVKDKLEVFTLMPILAKPINTLDINTNKVICGCDNEAIYLINNVMLY
ncbi:hypothetical protein NQ315_012092 [Exocentrus adspersus]|uniref:Nucleoporin Nup43 n=1 Tax=Exocentrus adspersus TaxID=1586481 RepID=A0AAV8VYE6_9CUCU|nr:hypothetical protein NQ315_012092 [Exocentrus adspersus]